MNSKERTLRFIANKSIDRVPFHPIIMRFAAKYAGVNYSDFCLDYKVKCDAMIKCANDFAIDWVTVMSDPYAEAEAYGMEFDYPENDLPSPKANLINDVESDIEKISILNIQNHSRLMNRIHEIEYYKKTVGENNFIVGWVEGPLGEYADVRGFQECCFDLYDHPDKIVKATDVILQNSIDFITAQVEAGADCIGIGDAVCSQISPDMYRKLFWEKEKKLVDHIHALGAIAKLHICGNTSRIQKDMIKTGADIIDVDHLVGSMAPYADSLGECQVFSGNSDPVSVVQNGNRECIYKSVEDAFKQTNGRCIVSAGCEITPDTTVENFKYFVESVVKLNK